MRQILTSLSSAPLTMQSPLGVMARQWILELWPVKVKTGTPVSTSHSLIVSSQEAGEGGGEMGLSKSCLNTGELQHKMMPI